MVQIMKYMFHVGAYCTVLSLVVFLVGNNWSAV